MEKLERFLSFAESLKLVRKAKIEDDGIDLIDTFYTDLLPKNGIINKVNLPRTTIVVGRKGTGKSTIFLKSQKDIDKNKSYLTIYIDVKSLYENSTPTFPDEISQGKESKELNKYLIYANFIREIIIKTKEKLRHRVEKRFSFSIFNNSKGEIVSDEVYIELDKIESSIDEVFKKLNSSLITSYKNTIDSKTEEKKNLTAGVNIKEGLNLNVSSGLEDATVFKKEFDNKLVSYLDLKKCLIDNLLKIRDLLKIKGLYIYLDDYSEIEKDAQVLFMDWFIAPLNNSSEDFVKFKIATYPKRFYYGKLDNGKIDEIPLDFFDAYYSYDKKNQRIDISRMENLALDYTSRLIENRLNYFFPDNHWETYFNIDREKLIKLLFDVSLNVPRKIGYILSYCYESCLIHGTRISDTSIENAAKRYYSDIIEKYFIVNEHICKPFEDKISNEHQYDLLLKIITRQIHNKEVLKRRKNKETSHFYVNNNLVYLLDNLELNGFLSTYNKVKDKLNITSTIFSLDYGLCKKVGLTFGCSEIGKLESNYSKPLFNFSSIIVDYFNSTQVIRCELDPKHEFPYSRLEEFKRFKMICPTCLENYKAALCTVTMKFQELKQQFSEQENRDKIALTFQEFLILENLNIYNNTLSFSRLTDLLDISKSTLIKAVKNVVDRGYCEYDIEVSKLTSTECVRITSKGVKILTRISSIIKRKIE